MEPFITTCINHSAILHRFYKTCATSSSYQSLGKVSYTFNTLRPTHTSHLHIHDITLSHGSLRFSVHKLRTQYPIITFTSFPRFKAQISVEVKDLSIEVEKTKDSKQRMRIVSACFDLETTYILHCTILSQLDITCFTFKFHFQL